MASNWKNKLKPSDGVAHLESNRERCLSFECRAWDFSRTEFQLKIKYFKDFTGSVGPTRSVLATAAAGGGIAMQGDHQRHQRFDRKD